MTEQDSGHARMPRVDLDAASAAELETLPGIGPAYAAAIVLAREQDGPFRSPDALVSRGIIPERVLEGILPEVQMRSSGPLAALLRPAAVAATAVRAGGARTWRAARRPDRTLRRGLRSRRTRVAIAVLATTLAIGAFPILTVVHSLDGGALSVDPVGAVSDATSAPPNATVEPPAGTETATASPADSATAIPTAVPVPDSPIRYIGDTGGDGVGLRTAYEDGARADGAWPEGTEVVLEERGTGACFSWSLVSGGDTTSWVRNIYLVEQPDPVAIVTGISASLPEPVLSRAQRHCIQYRLGGAYYQVCRTFPTLERALWTPWDLGTYGHLSYQRLQFFANCYVNNPRAGAPLDRCAFTPLNP